MLLHHVLGLDYAGKLGRCPGKTVLSQLSAWSQEEFGVSFGPVTLAADMRAEEVPQELADILRAVEEGGTF